MTQPTPTRDTNATTGAASALTPRQFGRWAWRQLTSMRTALILLFLLALAAIPGSVVPQAGVDAQRLAQWQSLHPKLTPWYEALGLFNVYSSPWFAAIYLLLMISLVGCILPRLVRYWKTWRAAPPKAPRNFSRLSASASAHTQEPLAALLERIPATLSGYRTVQVGTAADAIVEVSAERGKLREAGNLIFHLAILIVLVGFATGSLFGFRGGVIIIEGHTFAHALSQYDEFRPGTFSTPADLNPFDFTVTDFDVTFITEGSSSGMARNFSAGLDYRLDGGPTQHERIAVNHPVKFGGTNVFLVGHGYAPHFTVRDKNDDVVFSGPVVFLPEDPSFRSFGVIKVPDAGDDPDQQLGFEGEFYPTYAFIKGENGGPVSAFPDAMNPAVSLLAYQGNLGMDTGVAQSVYELKKDDLQPITDEGEPVRVDLMLGDGYRLPDGMGSITFDDVSRFVKLETSHSPGDSVALGGMVLVLAGLMMSLFIRPRRLWVRLRQEAGRTLVEVGALERGSGETAETEVAATLTALLASSEPKE